ncbi:tRNA uridine(34) 5-carboxymethylaminomethyl modification radical SAM/GNAT enzyme Elp3 [Candidatus Falkowbacteria bacterium CG_4_9_14_3_um_filter_36_9]|uniref:tRNA carboxymethyluridine synthase n=2 Tax=Candidatus Falkowiibacteriota TaxID=1752728 RepID=A0A1J4T5V9_9BACT|nr:MAG: hypothetical protein AUJ27_02400 [Candidatus Falkowbacteria bacterium CG1_02_37_44]PIV52086.1 MAG: tRNA uridine(34) 5-carboxymethylaminomethyl modification radical SAM/GNAT enzyme Elp3 [Candidatus Falkowbacteria bacterium CG02_land_8_20_14_3_00_36_14]PIX12336.1 MAG: tRNA uridine(34) 5-carboxymethylaminomethyl modification radical SAM/GNAT enzyme Elp3 [Candidatus Falkowbacteria bacterium CG_4_8_14_3_um_filter_36_11]PJA10411.1 MAG: tRNA uridine(34) 5-carboxymethylaminomethyl modification r
MSNINKQRAIKEIIRMKIKNSAGLMVVKRKMSKKYGIKILQNSDILPMVSPNHPLRKILKKRSVRTMSGIAPVAVLTKPYPCPANCAYCPTEKNVPKSYLSNEPAVMRAIRCGYNPYKQVQLRLQALEANGHEPNKIELIVIGGTWSALPEKYKYWFILNCFKAANDYKTNVILNVAERREESRGEQTAHKPRDPSVVLLPQDDGVKQNTSSLSLLRMTAIKKLLLKEQNRNEKAKYRIIGLTLETRPDYINEKEILEMRELGCTRVELGVQAIDDKILKKNKRGHGVATIAKATKLLKNYGFKVTYHIMPGLPGSIPAKDLKMFKQLFTDERFQPDQIKFYPTIVTRGSLLYKWWRAGKYKPYTDRQLQKLIIACKRAVPEYIRVIRLIRDIPGESIMAGNKITNLRQIIQNQGIKCRCIRCREARELRITNCKLRIMNYESSGGKEYFLQFTSKDGKILYGFCRLRLPVINKQVNTASFLRDTALIRELHVYGVLVPVGRNKKIQHSGLGKKLMQTAENIAKKHNYHKIAVISGVGAREYYRKLGYKLEKTYMVKLNKIR